MTDFGFKKQQNKFFLSWLLADDQNTTKVLHWRFIPESIFNLSIFCISLTVIYPHLFSDSSPFCPLPFWRQPWHTFAFGSVGTPSVQQNCATVLPIFPSLGRACHHHRQQQKASQKSKWRDWEAREIAASASVSRPHLQHSALCNLLGRLPLRTLSRRPHPLFLSHRSLEYAPEVQLRRRRRLKLANSAIKCQIEALNSHCTVRCCCWDGNFFRRRRPFFLFCSSLMVNGGDHHHHHHHSWTIYWVETTKWSRVREAPT